VSETSFQQEEKKWYQKHEKLRRLYHPLLLTKGSYRAWRREQKAKGKMKLTKKEFDLEIRKAEKTIPKVDFKKMIGREAEEAEVMDSILYWIAKDEKTRSEFEFSPPRRMIIIRGSSGVGKSFFVKCVVNKAFETLRRNFIPLYFFEIACSTLFSSWYGQSAKNMEEAFNTAMGRPCVIFLDELDAIAARMGELMQAADKEDVRVVKTLLKKLDEIDSNPELPIVVIAASNQYEKVPFDVRRRFGRPLDFDVGITSDMVLEVIKSQLERYKWNLKPEAIKNAIEQGAQAVGHSLITPDDIIRTFQQVYEEKRPSRLEKIKSKIPLISTEITLDDFKRVARTVRSFAEEEKVEVIRNFAAKVRPRETIRDVGGLFGKKEEIVKEITLALNPSISKEMGIEPARGFLLYGPPGTGKTLLAKAMANEANATLYLVNGPELLQKFTGQSEQAVRDLFIEARKNQPSIIFIDEIDAIAVARGIGGMPSLVNQLLSELDGMRGLEGIVVIATSNRPDILDPALLRPGRFTRQIEIPLPRNDEERLDILDVHLRKVAFLLDKTVSAEKVMELCKGKVQSPAELAQIVKDAVTLRVKDLLAKEKLLEARLNQERLNDVKQLYSKDLKRLAEILAIPDDDPKFYTKISELSEENYKVTMRHFELAVEELTTKEAFEQLRKAQEVYRSPEPEVGKVNALVALGEDARWGLIGIIECSVFPDGEGKIDVTGSVKESVVESTKQARSLLRKYFPEIKGYDIHIQLVTPMEGVDEQRLKAGGPSAGAAIAVALLSAITNCPVRSDVAITGKIDILAPGRVGVVGGVDWRGFGKIMAALQDGRIFKVCIPEANYKEIDARDLEFFEKRGVKIVPISTLWDAAQNLLVDAPSREQLISIHSSRVKTSLNN
jgi:SpoVK/Ycf46/Vps4 family AAA+-type ATPase